jgi:dipeptidyl aminopeptidase/acylaminoacyl peptidase
LQPAIFSFSYLKLSHLRNLNILIDDIVIDAFIKGQNLSTAFTGKYCLKYHICISTANIFIEMEYLLNPSKNPVAMPAFITMNRKFFFSAALIFICTCMSSQPTREDYRRADSTQKFSNLVYNTIISVNWIGDTYKLWYEATTGNGSEYFIVDATAGERKEAFDQKKLCDLLNSRSPKSYKPYRLPLRSVTFDDELKKMEFVADSVKWRLDLVNYDLEVVEKLKPDTREQRYWGEINDELAGDPVKSPDSVWVAFIRNYNVHIRNRNDEETYQLSFDGSEGEYYSTHLRWSPDSRYLAVNKIRPNTKKYIYFMESSPEDQLQPKLHKTEYLKPGDALQIRKPSLFSIGEKKQIPLDTSPFENQYRISAPQWREDSRAFTFEFNQRGHQAYQVVEVKAGDGTVRIMIDERSDTFIDYSGKRFRHDVDDGREIIWASERDGWNHLYLVDGNTGRVKNRITSGDWVVRGVDHVNDSSRYIIFRGAGRHQGEDPYLVRYYRVGFDGRDLIELTPEEASHSATFSSDFRFFVDNYSRIDKPPVALLRESANGRILMELEEADISDLLDRGWNTPEVFVTKGRDGETDIWGNIYRPSNFDPSKSYPVIEAIYAGPHSAHVPKTFRPYFGNFSGLAELGFIIVQIDGMGTSHRSKGFHDVCWQNLKDAGFPDRILWIKAAAEKYPYMDTVRVGIFGGSAGGQSAMGALLFHPEFYKAAVASVGCHDNRMDKIWWNEQWMGYPLGPHYEASSNVVNAHKLKGKLLLTVGEMDNNVDPSSTLQVVNALIKAGKDFEFMLFPGQGHGSGGIYGERQKRDFFVRHLMGLETPDWNLEVAE